MPRIFLCPSSREQGENDVSEFLTGDDGLKSRDLIYHVLNNKPQISAKNLAIPISTGREESFPGNSFEPPNT
jgi:hypothetical protein